MMPLTVSANDVVSSRSDRLLSCDCLFGSAASNFLCLGGKTSLLFRIYPVVWISFRVSATVLRYLLQSAIINRACFVVDTRITNNMFLNTTPIPINDIASDTCQAGIDSSATALFFFFVIVRHLVKNGVGFPTGCPSASYVEFVGKPSVQCHLTYDKMCQSQSGRHSPRATAVFFRRFQGFLLESCITGSLLCRGHRSPFEPH